MILKESGISKEEALNALKTAGKACMVPFLCEVHSPSCPLSSHPESRFLRCSEQQDKHRAEDRTNTGSRFGQKPIPKAGGKDYLVTNTKMRAPTG
jgi:hypothetical protein